ncbi:1-phosphofructokinase, partial [Amycolatopsis sp. SID8362]|nr:1-phosphofructokinase [Amycolatopsis sp. SID8362]NED40541.1 1-phosphofructokinase [Amycolatopsis sp. SID8362]
WPEILRRAVALSGAAVLGPLAGDVDLAHYHRELAAVRVRPEQES